MIRIRTLKRFCRVCSGGETTQDETLAAHIPVSYLIFQLYSQNAKKPQTVSDLILLYSLHFGFILKMQKENKVQICLHPFDPNTVP